MSFDQQSPNFVPMDSEYGEPMHLGTSPPRRRVLPFVACAAVFVLCCAAVAVAVVLSQGSDDGRTPDDTPREETGSTMQATDVELRGACPQLAIAVPPAEAGTDNATLLFEPSIVCRVTGRADDVTQDASVSWEVDGARYTGAAPRISLTLPHAERKVWTLRAVVSFLDSPPAELQEELSYFAWRSDVIDAAEVCAEFSCDSVSWRCVLAEGTSTPVEPSAVMRSECGVLRVQSVGEEGNVEFSASSDIPLEDVLAFAHLVGSAPSYQKVIKTDGSPAATSTIEMEGRHAVALEANTSLGKDTAGSWSMSASASLSASASAAPFFSFVPVLRHVVRIGFFTGVEEVTLAAEGTMTAGVELVLAGALDGSFTAEREVLSDRRALYAVTVLLGPVPMVITVGGSLSVGITFEGGLHAELRRRFEVGGRVAVGASYVAGEGFRSLNSFTAYARSSTELEMQCSLTLHPYLKPGLTFRLFNTAPFVRTEVNVGFTASRTVPAPVAACKQCVPSGALAHSYDTLEWNVDADFSAGLLKSPDYQADGQLGSGTLFEGCNPVMEGFLGACVACPCTNLQCECQPGRCETPEPEPEPGTPTPAGATTPGSGVPAVSPGEGALVLVFSCDKDCATCDETPKAYRSGTCSNGFRYTCDGSTTTVEKFETSGTCFEKDLLSNVTVPQDTCNAVTKEQYVQYQCVTSPQTNHVGMRRCGEQKLLTISQSGLCSKSGKLYCRGGSVVLENYQDKDCTGEPEYDWLREGECRNGHEFVCSSFPQGFKNLGREVRMYVCGSTDCNDCFPLDTETSQPLTSDVSFFQCDTEFTLAVTPQGRSYTRNGECINGNSDSVKMECIGV